MPVSFRILPEHFLIYVRYEGCVTTPENVEKLAECVAHPDYERGMRLLADFAAVTDWDRDYVALMKNQADLTEMHDNPFQPTMVACYAPDAFTSNLARTVTRTWEDSGRLLAVVVNAEDEALEVLGIGMASFAELLQAA